MPRVAPPPPSPLRPRPFRGLLPSRTVRAEQWYPRRVLSFASPNAQEEMSTHHASPRCEGGSRDNLISSYSSDTLAALALLVGVPAEGMWRLAVMDLEGRDVGKLNQWTLELLLE